MASQKLSKKLIAFHVSNEEAEIYRAEARAAGFSSVSAYCRAIIDRARGTPELESAMLVLGTLRARIQKNAMNAVHNTLSTLTAEELLTEDND